nr:hypothetical protein [Tanacetum cinerariifolium]
MDTGSLLETKPRHRDSNVLDDFTISHNEEYADMMAEKIIPLRKPPHSLLFIDGLTTVYHHPDLAQILWDPKGRGNSVNIFITFEEITIDDYLCLPNQTRTVVSKGDPIPEDQRPPKRTIDLLPQNTTILAKTPYQINVEKPDPNITKAREKKDQQALLKAKAKRADEGGVDGPQKKRREKKEARLRSERTISIEPLHHSHKFQLRLDGGSIIHDGCLVLDDKLNEPNNNLQRQQYEGLSKKHDLLENAHSVCSDQEKELLGSAEYKKLVDVPVSLSFTIGWLRGVDVGQTEEELEKYDELFTKGYPYIQKIVDSHTLPFEELMKVISDVPTVSAKVATANVKSSTPYVPYFTVRSSVEDQVNKSA